MMVSTGAAITLLIKKWVDVYALPMEKKASVYFRHK